GCQFLGKRLISWQCKKKTVVANSITEAEYVAAANCCRQIIDFLNASYVKYALTVNLTVYTSCIEQFGATAKVKNVNGEAQIQVLVDKKKVIINEASIRKDLTFEDERGVDCLSNEFIFEQLTLMGFVQVFLDNQVKGMDRHNANFVISSHTKKVFANMKREGKDFSGKVTPLFETMMVQAPEDMGKGVPITSNDPLPSGEDRMQLNELMILCTNLQKQVLDFDEAKTAQAKEIASLKKRVKKLEQKRKSRTLVLKRLRKIGSARRVESSTKSSLGDQEDASKQGRMIDNIDQDVETTLVDDTQGRMKE
nr:putative reverse transcriptase, RNA-dependent DNA polymerase [Tanacetum cinerariifolium]